MPLHGGGARKRPLVGGLSRPSWKDVSGCRWSFRAMRGGHDRVEPPRVGARMGRDRVRWACRGGSRRSRRGWGGFARRGGRSRARRSGWEGGASRSGPVFGASEGVRSRLRPPRRGCRQWIGAVAFESGGGPSWMAAQQARRRAALQGDARNGDQSAGRRLWASSGSQGTSSSSSKRQRPMRCQRLSDTSPWVL